MGIKQEVAKCKKCGKIKSVYKDTGVCVLCSNAFLISKVCPSFFAKQGEKTND